MIRPLTIITLAWLGSLMVQAEEYRDFRFSFNPSFKPSMKLTVHVRPEKSTLRIEVRPSSGRKKTFDQKRELAEAEIEELKRLLRPLDVKQLKKDKNPQGLDGATWTLAFSENGFSEENVTLWGPSDHGGKKSLMDFYKLGEYLWKLSGTKGDPGWLESSTTEKATGEE